MAAVETFDVTGPKGEGKGGGLFGVFLDPHTYGAVLYMLLALPLGIAYFTFVTVGLSLSIPLLVLIIGVPVLLTFVLLARFLAQVEGQITKFLLGADIPVRDEDGVVDMDSVAGEDGEGQTTWNRIWSWVKMAFSDFRTYTSMLYMGLMLPLGTAYFTVAVTGFVTSVAFIFAPMIKLLGLEDALNIEMGSSGSVDLSDAPSQIVFLDRAVDSPIGLVVMMLLGLVGFVVMLHVARGIGFLHGKLASAFLVRRT